MRGDIEVRMKPSEDSVMVIDLGKAEIRAGSSSWVTMRNCQPLVRSLSDRASAPVVSPTPGSARAQVSGRFRTLTTPQRVTSVTRSATARGRPRHRRSSGSFFASRHPASCSERAPLRRVAATRGTADRRCHPAPQERAPLRLDGRSGRPRQRQVIPLLRSGLHCGVPTAPVRRPVTAPSSRPSRSGLHCGAESSAASAGQRVVPPLEERAPLRRDRVPRSRLACGVIPPLRSGLHCGRRGSLSAGRIRVIPLARGAGSIAAWSGSTAASEPVVIPPLRSGLHCGSASQPGAPRSAPVSSRPSGAGSIAASRPRRDRSRCARGHPAPRGAGSIAADDVGRSGQRRPVIPLLEERAPLRPLAAGARRPRGRSSRSSGAGSIAAASSRAMSGRGVGGSSRSSERAPLRRRPAAGRGAERSSRSSGAGSIAARTPASRGGRPVTVIPLLDGAGSIAAPRRGRTS